jgi:hypothetical protein
MHKSALMTRMIDERKIFTDNITISEHRNHFYIKI